MEKNRIPKPGEIYNHFMDKPYQIITVATNTETRELMVVYQALYGDFKTYVRPLEMFIGEVDKNKYPEVKQKYRFELHITQDGENVNSSSTSGQTNKEAWDKKPVEVLNEITDEIADGKSDKIVNETSDKIVNKTSDIIAIQTINEKVNEIADGKQPKIENVTEESVNAILLKFLDADSYTKKLEILTSNMKHIDNRLINDMAVSLDCTVDEGSLDQRIQGLIFCLQAMRRFEDRRLR